MKRGSTTSWRSASAAAALLAALAPAILAAVVGADFRPPQSAAPAAGAQNQRAHELTLARLRPGQDTLEAARAAWGGNFRRVVPDSDDVLAWVDARRGLALRMELRDDEVIESISLLDLKFLPEAEGSGPEVSLTRAAAGRGLAIGDHVRRVLQLYGLPASRGPAALAGRELEFLFYAFDWAGSDVPQVMEVTCERSSGRVVKITLAASSL